MKKNILIIISFCMIIFTSCNSIKKDVNINKKSMVICEASTYPMVVDLVDNYNANSNKHVEVKLVDNIEDLKNKQEKNTIIISYEDKKLKNLSKEPLGMEAIAIVVNRNNNIKNITTENLNGIYSGFINNWSEINGKAAPIKTLFFSGTEKFFDKEAKSKTNFNNNKDVKKQVEYVNNKNSFKKIVNNNQNVLALIPMMHLDKDLKSVNLNNIALNANNIKNGLYPMTISINMYHNEKIQEDLSEFIRYVKSDNGKKIIKKHCVDGNS